jgi:hypothetical protein
MSTMQSITPTRWDFTASEMAASHVSNATHYRDSARRFAACGDLPTAAFARREMRFNALMAVRSARRYRANRLAA